MTYITPPPRLIIGFSGPPRAGKDSAMQFAKAALRLRGYQPAVRRMSAPLKTIAAMLIPAGRYAFDENKDTAFSTQFIETDLDGVVTTRPVSFRSLQIDLYRFGAERLGADWLGQVFVRDLRYQSTQYSPILVPDFGRPEEVQVLIDAGHQVHQIVIDRPGTTFEGDSRVSFQIPGAWSISNGGTLEDLQSSVSVALSSLLPPSHRPPIPTLAG